MNASTLSNISFSLLSMGTLYERLMEICGEEFQIDRPKNVDIQKVTGLSSGRVTQIKQERDGAKIGTDALAKLVSKGYNPEWVRFGIGEKRLANKKKPDNQQNVVRESEPRPYSSDTIELLKLIEATPAEERQVLIELIKLRSKTSEQTQSQTSFLDWADHSRQKKPKTTKSA